MSLSGKGLTLYERAKFRPVQLKAFAEDKLNMVQNFKLVLGRVENTVGKGENAGHQYFFLFPQCLPKCFPLESSKLARLCSEE